jgi:hypothetical protein
METEADGSPVKKLCTRGSDAPRPSIATDNPSTDAASHGDQTTTATPLDANGPLFARWLTPVECGGKGDCAYCSIATALHEANPNAGKNALAPEDLVPRRRAQAQLRLLAAKELEKFSTHYPATTTAHMKTTRTAGNDVDSLSIHALAQASNLELRVWAYDANLQR